MCKKSVVFLVCFIGLFVTAQHSNAQYSNSQMKELIESQFFMLLVSTSCWKKMCRIR